MAQKLPLSDFRAVRYKLEPHEFALSEGPDPPPTNLIDEATWAGMMHLPDDVAIRVSDHNGHRLALLYNLWGDWIEATGDPENPDELFSCMPMQVMHSNVPTFSFYTATASRGLGDVCMACFAATSANGLPPTKRSPTRHFANCVISHTRARTPATVRFGKATAPYMRSKR
jgi:hypothetical protein